MPKTYEQIGQIYCNNMHVVDGQASRETRGVSLTQTQKQTWFAKASLLPHLSELGIGLAAFKSFQVIMIKFSRRLRKAIHINITMVTPREIVVDGLEKCGVIVWTPRLVPSFQPTVYSTPKRAMMTNLSMKRGQPGSIGSP